MHSANSARKLQKTFYTKKSQKKCLVSDYLALLRCALSDVDTDSFGFGCETKGRLGYHLSKVFIDFLKIILEIMSHDLVNVDI